MARKPRQQSPQQFNGIPGTGVLMPKSPKSQGVWIWQGPMTLADGTRLVMFGTAVPEHGCDVTFKKPGKKKGEWETLGECHVDSFAGSRLAQDVSVVDRETGEVVVGPMKAYPGVTRDGQNCVRFQIVSKNGRPNAQVF